jgi:hypothetical protein
MIWLDSRSYRMSFSWIMNKTRSELRSHLPETKGLHRSWSISTMLDYWPNPTCFLACCHSVSGLAMHLCVASYAYTVLPETNSPFESTRETKQLRFHILAFLNTMNGGLATNSPWVSLKDKETNLQRNQIITWCIKYLIVLTEIHLVIAQQNNIGTFVRMVKRQMWCQTDNIYWFVKNIFQIPLIPMGVRNPHNMGLDYRHWANRWKGSGKGHT